ncbi:MAG: c-type cytochrome [Chitinophagaceae bacterium]
MKRKKILKAIGIIVSVIILAVAGMLIYIKFALPNVGAAPDLKVDVTSERIKRGEYLANHITVCMDCHSTRNFSLFSGPLTAGTLGQGGEVFDQSFGFPGKYISKNITPYHLKDWTDGEIYRTITTGVNKDNKALFPIMPWEGYGKMDPEDIKDIIAYVRSLAPIAKENEASSSDFPINFIINTMPHKAEPGTRPAKTDPVAYGGYLVNAAGCAECHSERSKGKLIGELFAGGFQFHFPDGAVVRSANISPDMETGIGKWSEAAFVSRFRSYTDSSFKPTKVAPGQMQTVMPWTMYGGMDTTDLKAIYAYLRTVKPQSRTIVKWTPKG